jgi:thiol-disulfide isomerase/thioredoxin
MVNRWTVVTAAVLFGASGAMAQTVVPKKKDKKTTTAAPSQPAKPTDKPSEGTSSTLKVGDKAPQLSIEEWVKGTKVEKFDAGKIYVVEFWATWCGPCKESIPHLNDLQKTYKDKNVVVIGVAGSERGSNEKQKLDGVKNFVKAKADGMNYTIAYDADRSMSRDWMTPAGRNTIPTAMLVGSDGKMLWIGDPRDEEMEKQLKKAVAANKVEPVKKVGGLDFSPRIALASFQPEKQPTDAKASAAGPSVKLGSKAPALTVSDWVQGQPVTGFEKGHAYIVEFWTTASADSRTSADSKKLAPHLSALQKKHANVTVLGIVRKDQSTESATKVAEFLKTTDAITYPVGFDAERATVESWSKAANLKGAPQVFVVTQDGTIGWLGNPLRAIEELDEVVDLAAAGKLNAESSRATTDKWMAERQKRIELNQAYRDAVPAEDYKGAIAALDKLISTDKFNAPDYAGLKYRIMYIQMKDPAAAIAYGAEAVDGVMKDDSNGLNTIAWTIVDPENAGVEKKDLKLALKAAERANQLTKGKDAYILDTLAKVYFDSGDHKKAIELQEQAVKLVDPADANAGEIKTRLDEYKADKAK